MARKWRLDRGLVSRKDVKGRIRWYVRLADQGRERWFGSFPTKTEARRFYEARKLEQLEGRFFPSQYHRRGQATLPQLIEGYMATNNKCSKRDDRRYAKLWTARFGNAKVGTITAASIEAVRQSLLQKGLAPSSTNRALAFLRHVLNRAVRDGVLTASPMAKVKFLKESPGRLRFLDPEEETVLCEEIGLPYGAWIRLAILTGLRQMEQFSLRWECVDLERALLTIPHTKAGGARYVHLNAEAVKLLRGISSWMTSQWVFPSENPGSHLDPRHFYARIFLPAVKRLRLEGVSWHTLRHTFASRLAMAGATEQDIAACLGHSTTALVRRYAHLSPSHLKSVVERVSTFRQVITESSQVETQSNPQTANSPIDSSISIGTVIEPRLGDLGGSSERM